MQVPPLHFKCANVWLVATAVGSADTVFPSPQKVLLVAYKI